MANRAFWRALNSLAHPLTMLAVVALVLNDHWLRWELPSWWTGKLGDFAWLLFAPFLCALALAWLIPQRWQSQERFVGIVSIVFIGAWFALAKTVPFVHALTVNTLDNIVGWQGGLRMDATDRLTLPALFLSWHIWRNARNTAPRVPLGYVVTALGLMGTLASSPPPPTRGIVEFCQVGDVLYAYAEVYYFDIYSSADSGLTWTKESANTYPEFNDRCLEVEDFYDRRSSISGVFGPYEIVAGDGVHRSDIRILDLIPFYHDSYKILHETGLPGNPQYVPGPLDALYDAQTGHLLLAMSLDGILLIEDDHWQWVTIGDYHPVNLDEPSSILYVLQLELIFALGLLVLPSSTITLSARNMNCFNQTALLLGWLMWFFSVISIGAERDGWVAIMAGIPLGIICIGLALWGMKRIFQHPFPPVQSIMLIVLTLGIVALYLLPYALWARRTVPNHGTATLFALLLVGGAMFTAVPYFRWRFPARKKKKHPDNDEPLPPPIEHVDTYIEEDDAD